jgi:hypothetical protein
VTLSDEIGIEADTFDWWIPVAPPFTIDKPFDETLKHMRSLGWSVGDQIDTAMLTVPMQMMQTMQTTMAWSGSRLGAAVAQNNGLTTPELYWKKAGTPDGQRRDVGRVKVRIRYKLQWIGDELTVFLWSRPEDRSYIVYLVLEEQMQGSANVLHTAVAVPVNGLLTYVPQGFFDEEFAAHAKTAAIIARLIPKYIPTVDDIGSDEGINWLRPGDLASRSGIVRFMTEIETKQPEFYQEIVRELDVEIGKGLKLRELRVPA